MEIILTMHKSFITPKFKVGCGMTGRGIWLSGASRNRRQQINSIAGRAMRKNFELMVRFVPLEFFQKSIETMDIRKFYLQEKFIIFLDIKIYTLLKCKYILLRIILLIIEI